MDPTGGGVSYPTTQRGTSGPVEVGGNQVHPHHHDQDAGPGPPSDRTTHRSGQGARCGGPAARCQGRVLCSNLSGKESDTRGADRAAARGRAHGVQRACVSPRQDPQCRPELWTPAVERKLGGPRPRARAA